MKLRFVLLSSFLVGCGSSVETPADQFDPAGQDGGADGTPGSTVCAAKVSLLGSTVVEIRSKEPTTIELLAADDGGARGVHPIKVVLSRDGAPIKTLLSASTELGKVTASLVAADALLSPGKYTIEATLGCPTDATSKTEGSAKGDLFAVRLGAMRVDVGAGDGERVPLMYHAVSGVAGSSFPLDEKIAASSFDVATDEADLDDKDGAARTFPEPWADLSTPKTDAAGAVMEEGATYPVSLKVGTKPDVTLTLGKTALVAGKVVPGGVATAGLPDLRLALDAATATDAKLVDGGTATFRLNASPVENVGRYELPLTWHFEAKDASGWKTIAGSKQSVKLVLYGVLGNEIGTSPPNLPWVAVVDAATKEIAGKTKDPTEVRAMLVRLVYEDFGLSYDRKNGASFYTTYPSGYASARFDLTSFLKRSRGNVVNCTDCASILSTYANMVGAKLHYAIIGWNFSLNPILGIGATAPGSPFDSGRLSFSYHAVTTPDSTATIDDATLAVDGDSDPTTAPFSKALVQNLTGADYLKRLSPGAPEYKYADQITTVR